MTRLRLLQCENGSGNRSASNWIENLNNMTTEKGQIV